MRKAQGRGCIFLGLAEARLLAAATYSHYALRLFLKNVAGCVDAINSNVVQRAASQLAGIEENIAFFDLLGERGIKNFGVADFT